ncbi:unnamed protein product [Prunus brigantina]
MHQIVSNFSSLVVNTTNRSNMKVKSFFSLLPIIKAYPNEYVTTHLIKSRFNEITMKTKRNIFSYIIFQPIKLIKPMSNEVSINS